MLLLLINKHDLKIIQTFASTLKNISKKKNWYYFINIIFFINIFAVLLLLTYHNVHLYIYSWRIDSHTYPNVRGKLPGNSKNVLHY